MKKKVAIVTGANKGIGLEIVRQLAKCGFRTILTARDESRGRAAVSLLARQGLVEVEFLKLDVSDPSSIASFVEQLQQRSIRPDVLVNNAAVMSVNVSGDDVERAKQVLETNFYGTKRVCEQLLPLMPDGGRIINVSSNAGNLEWLPHAKWRTLLSKENESRLSVEMLDEFVSEFLDDLNKGEGLEKWPNISFWTNITDYAVSKAAVNAYTRCLARQLQIEQQQGEDESGKRSSRQVFVNCMCPGLTSTGMTQFMGHGADVGADTVVWMALPTTPPSQGCFFGNRRQISYFELPADTKKAAAEGVNDASSSL